MICQFYAEDCSQKELYFKICNIIGLENKETTIVGLYAIYKNDICLYVGQSKNLASRITTHLKGKYKDADFIYMLNIEDIGFSDFKERNEESKNSILDNCEKYLIKLLKPIENIIVDFDFNIPKEQAPNISEYLPYCYVVDSRDLKVNGHLTVQNDLYYGVTCVDWLRVCIYKLEKTNDEFKELIDNYNTIFINDIEVKDEH